MNVAQPTVNLRMTVTDTSEHTSMGLGMRLRLDDGGQQQPFSAGTLGIKDWSTKQTVPMTKVAHHSAPDNSRRSGLRTAGLDLALALVPLAILAATFWWLFGLPDGYLAQVAVAYLCLAFLLVWYLPAGPLTRGLGAANRVTLGRATLILPLSALAVQPVLLTNALAWLIIALGTVAMVLDGVDGWVARQSATSSTFGARFDMELDSFLMLVLSILVWRSEKVGAWAILIGLPRYLYVAASWVWPMLRGELPPSIRRKAVCVAQGVLLLVCLGPIIPPALATAAAAAALALLAWSFAVDIHWLSRWGPSERGS